MSDAGSNAPGIGQATKDQRAEDLARAKAAGWADPIPFDYVPAAPSGEGSGDHASPAWLSDAVVYAWEDDFGDVGPANPELEKALFGDDNLQRAGGAIQALSFHVEITGPEKVLPVRTVSLQPLTKKSHVLMKYSLKKPVSTLSWLRTSSSVSTIIQLPFRRSAFPLSCLDTTSSALHRLVCHFSIRSHTKYH
jgi:ATP-dependent RNA helicase DDX3X